MSNTTEPKYSLFNGQIKFDDPAELKKYIQNADGPEIAKILSNVLDAANLSGSYTLGESVMVSEIFERTMALLSLVTKKVEE